jgi:hypothetical protein
MLVRELTVVMRLCGVMLGVLVLFVLVMMGRLVVVMRCRMMMCSGQMMTFVSRMFSHDDISRVVVALRGSLQSRCRGTPPRVNDPLGA